jgi:hypothetical protein
MCQRLQFQVGIDPSGDDANFAEAQPGGKEFNAILHEQGQNIFVVKIKMLKIFRVKFKN